MTNNQSDLKEILKRLSEVKEILNNTDGLHLEDNLIINSYQTIVSMIFMFEENVGFLKEFIVYEETGERPKFYVGLREKDKIKL